MKRTGTLIAGGLLAVISSPAAIFVVGALIAVLFVSGGGYNTSVADAAATTCATAVSTEPIGSATESPSSTGASAAESVGDQMPYPLPATEGTTGAEEPVDATGRVPTTGGAVTWSKHAALGQPWRDYYITMRWNYAAWNWDGTSSDIDQAQYQWFAAAPRLVLVTNPRTSASIIAAAIEAGPGPWVGVVDSTLRGQSNGPPHGWTNPTRGTPAGWTGIVSGFPPTALQALGAITGYPGQTGDRLIYQWAPDQSATPGPTGATATQRAATNCTVPACTATADTGPDTATAETESVDTAETAVATKSAAAGCTPIALSGVTVTIPNRPDVPAGLAGKTVTAPNDAVARGIAAGFAQIGTPYVWGGGTDGGPPDEGCNRGGGSLNSCQGVIGLDCSGLTGYTLTQAGFTVPTNSTGQRAAGTSIARTDALAGDIIGYSGHVALYLGTIDGAEYMLEAPQVGDNVHIRTARWSGADANLHRYWH